MVRKSKTPKLDLGGSSSSAYLNVHPRSGAVTLAASHASAVPQPSVSSLANQSSSRKRKSESALDTAGAAWGHMRAPTLTAELKRELLLVKMRDAIDPKRFYRSADGGKALPKYFQMGTIVEGAEDSSSHRLTKRERKGSMLQELMSDETVRKRAKTQFLKSQAANAEGVKRRFKPVKRGSKGAGGKRR